MASSDTPAPAVPLDGPRLVELLATLSGYLRHSGSVGERYPERVASDLAQVNGLSDAIKRGLLADAALLARIRGELAARISRGHWLHHA